MKKFFALVLSAFMILGLLSGCGSNSNTETTPATTESAAPIGTLIITMGATFELPYDAQGNALEINGTNATGKTIAENCQQNVGRGSVFAARTMLRYASDNNLIGDAKTMAVRVKQGDPLPSEDFLDTIITDCQYLADEESTGIRMVLLDGDALDANGNLTAETAKRMAARFLGCTEAELAEEDAPVEGVFAYSYNATICTVDAVTGLVEAL